MEARPAVSVQNVVASQLSNCGASGTLSSSLCMFPTALGEKYPKFPDLQQASMEKELKQHPGTVASSLPSNSGAVGHMFSSSSGFSADLHFSSVSTQEKHSGPTSFISQSTYSETSITFPHSGVLQSTASSQYLNENHEPWCIDPLPNFLDYSVDTPVQNSQVACSDKQSDWQEWADLVINDEDALTSNWNDIMADTSIADLELKVSLFCIDCSIYIPHSFAFPVLTLFIRAKRTKGGIHSYLACCLFKHAVSGGKTTFKFPNAASPRIRANPGCACRKFSYCSCILPCK